MFASVAGRGEVELVRVERKDPMVNELFLRNPDSKKVWVNAMPSSHLWEADLPEDLTAGVYTVAVRVIDEFGRTLHSHSVLEIEGR